MIRRVKPNVTATAVSTARPSANVERKSRKNARMESSTSEVTRSAVFFTSLMIASYSATKSGKLPANPTRRCPPWISAAWRPTTFCIRLSRPRASATPRLVPVGRTTMVRLRRSGCT